MAGTLCAFNVIIGDLAPGILSNLFGLEVRYAYLLHDVA
jgi:hypothetical protein